MAFCINCGQELANGAKFCAYCGTTTNNPASQRRTVFEGEIHKCPSCGETVNSFLINCPICGHEFRGSEASNSIRSLMSKINEIEKNRKERKTPSFFKSLLENTDVLTAEDEQIVALIKNFSIPNTKEDILEFMIIASSNIDTKIYGNNTETDSDREAASRAISDAWKSKLEQAYQKALFSFSNGLELERIEKIYNQKIKEVNKEKRKKELELPLLFGYMFGLILLIAIIGFFLQ